jgi:hypothetical protein
MRASVSFVISLILVRVVACGKPRIDFVERTLGDTQGNANLAPRFLTLANLLVLMPREASAQHGHQNHGSRQPLPKNHVALVPQRPPAGARIEDASLEPRRRRAVFKGLAQFALELVDRFRLHGRTPSIG